MGILSRIFGTKIVRAKQVTLTPEPTEINILNLKDYYQQAIAYVLEEGSEKNPISYVNENLHVKCPRCGIDYNANGFEIGLLASLLGGIKQGIPTTFTSGDKGIYPRCIKGICPNQNCSSRISSIWWLGGNVFSSLWKKIETNYFNITYPSKWILENTEQGFEICPPDNPSRFDETLGKDVASPGINITVRTIPDRGLNYVTEFIKYRENEGYEGYRFIKFYLNEIKKPNPAAIYEFQYGHEHSRFIAISSIKQHNEDFFNITASGKCEDIEEFRKTLERIIFSFHVNKISQGENNIENFEKCSICNKSVLSTDASKMTPRQLAGMQIDGSDVSAGGLVAHAISIITFNNPSGSEDRPMFWVCKHCQSSRLSLGDYKENINQSEMIKQLFDRNSKKKW